MFKDKPTQIRNSATFREIFNEGAEQKPAGKRAQPERVFLFHRKRIAIVSIKPRNVSKHSPKRKSRKNPRERGRLRGGRALATGTGRGAILFFTVLSKKNVGVESLFVFFRVFSMSIDRRFRESAAEQWSNRPTRRFARFSKKLLNNNAHERVEDSNSANRRS